MISIMIMIRSELERAPTDHLIMDAQLYLLRGDGGSSFKASRRWAISTVCFARICIAGLVTSLSVPSSNSMCFVLQSMSHHACVLPKLRRYVTVASWIALVRTRTVEIGHVGERIAKKFCNNNFSVQRPTSFFSLRLPVVPVA